MDCDRDVLGGLQRVLAKYSYKENMLRTISKRREYVNKGGQRVRQPSLHYTRIGSRLDLHTMRRNKHNFGLFEGVIRIADTKDNCVELSK